MINYKKSLIITSLISIILICILFIGSTYSIFTTRDVDENTNVYTTGNLDITYTLDSESIKLENIIPTSNDDSVFIKPYRITVTNTGNVAYKFNVILTDTTSTEKIDFQYIMTQVGTITSKPLSECTNNIIKEGVVVDAGSSVDIDVRVWLSDSIQNSEIGKSFYAKLSIDGIAVYNENTNIDNSDLIANYYDSMLLSEVSPGSYVAYTGNNGCSGNSCQGQNANYVSDTDMGYCSDSNYKFSVNGWRVGYISDGTAYLVSAGAPECVATDKNGNMDNTGTNTDTYLDKDNLYKHLNNLDNESLLYCNTSYAYGGVCNSTSTWAMDAADFEAITGSALSSSSCYGSSEDTSCGYGNDLIDNGGFYWYATRYSASSYRVFIWLPANRYVYNDDSRYALGLRPVLHLQSSVRVVGGSGTYEDPYTIASTN